MTQPRKKTVRASKPARPPALPASVFIVTHLSYDGDSIVGVYATQDLADRAKAEAELGKGTRYSDMDEIDTEEHEVEGLSANNIGVLDGVARRS